MEKERHDRKTEIPSQQRELSEDAQPQMETGKQRPDTPVTLRPVQQETWTQAAVTWNPGNRTITASRENLKATTENRELVPEVFHRKLFEKRKAVITTVTVERLGNAFRIVRIEPET